MNIAMTERGVATAQPLKDKVAVVTGSTSGIGLGIARALAAAGASIVLNGFGKPEEIKATQTAIGSEFGVPVSIPPPTCQTPIRSPR
jgi:3-hydroxybutyrate dehydrogenase